MRGQTAVVSIGCAAPCRLKPVTCFTQDLAATPLITVQANKSSDKQAADHRHQASAGGDDRRQERCRINQVNDTGRDDQPGCTWGAEHGECCRINQATDTGRDD